MKYRFNLSYFLFALILLLTEIVIGVFIKDSIIRPYGGDFLVVILLYCLVRSFFDIRLYTALIGVLLFAYLVETLQYFKIVNVLGLQDSTAARILIGTSFAWTDMLMYTLGIGLVWAIELRNKN